MVDRIKFIVDNADVSEEILNTKFFQNKPNKEGTIVYTYRNNYIQEEDVNEDETDDNKVILQSKYSKYLFIQYVQYKTSKKLPNVNYNVKNKLIVHRNVRKDWYKIPKVGDLGYKSFEKMINKYGEEFGIKSKALWNARVTKVELGLTLRLPIKMKGILSCFHSFSGLSEKNIYGQNGVSFIGNNFSVSFYDKIEKMKSNNELFPKSSNKQKLIEKITKKNYFLRFELKVEKVSGFYNKMYDDKINHLFKIRDEWDYLLKSLSKLFKQVNYIDVVSPEVMDSIRGEEKKPMDSLLKFQGIKSITPDVFFEELLPQMKKDKHSKFKKEYRDFYNEYERKFRYGFKEDFQAKLDEMIDLLIKRS
ncbi:MULTISPECIES: hypothetical protein [Chryseobacterium]|uniref:Replication initiation factor n=1 Tax=Chryseobacterium taihuense TaxID=1141221 RepID=A0A4U8WAG6_9FLAO|nr:MULTISPECIES: hypothetical protein [Chryseobacterium]QQV01228.1 hypothetical protein I6I61_08910 [Chryseobacterium sp. FDAARGOS 1104]VFB02180.1 Uncharacterised protein [Chryseobacterium taihuense]